MTRFPQFKYVIGRIQSDKNQIFIQDQNDSGWEKNLFDSWADGENRFIGPVEFLLRIKEKTGWAIKKAGFLQYAFEEDPLQLIFQMDDLFGFVIVTNKENLENAISFLQQYID